MPMKVFDLLRVKDIDWRTFGTNSRCLLKGCVRFVMEGLAVEPSTSSSSV